MSSEPRTGSADGNASRPRLGHWLKPAPWLRGFVFWGGAVATGATAVGFARLSDTAQQLFHIASQRMFLWPWLAPPIGLLRWSRG